ncbi:HIR complex subunit [Homalodisca vitripennis]|nr:HIR complex subunit [Homalodisca vitripennis]
MAASKEVTQVQRLERPFRPLPGPAVEDFKLCLQNIDWGVTLKGLSAEEMYNKFHNVFIGWMNIYLPMRNSRTNNFKNYHKPKGLRNWYTPQLAKMKEMVMSLFNISQATEDPRDAKNYKLAKINYKSALKQAKFHANQEFIQSSSNTCKAAWQIIKHETQPKQQQHATPDADSFNEYFISVVDEIREKIPAANTKPDELLEVQHLPSHQSFAWQPIEYSDIVKWSECPSHHVSKCNA